MTRFKIKNRKILICCLVLVLLVHAAKSSEFPERECCDPPYPPVPEPEPIPPALPTTTTILSSSSLATPTGRSGSNIKTAIAILNCILARQLCFEDPSCSAILEIIPRVCGPVPVACSTVTVTKCQAALRTLQAFPFFRPTCLCKEPGVDPDCNNFRDFLFDHPCGFVLKKEKDPYPIDALPTCNHALSVCQQERKCIKLFEDFKTHCKVRDNKCRMEDRDLCHESWTNLRLSPMFGCICPNNHMKRRCDRIFSMVNHNPCVDVILLPDSQRTSLETSSNSVYSESGEDSQVSSSFPYFLFPSRKIPLALASHRPATDDYYTSSSSSSSSSSSKNINNNFYSYNITNTNANKNYNNNNNDMMGTSTILDEHEYNINNNKNNHNNNNQNSNYNYHYNYNYNQNNNNNHNNINRSEYMLHQHHHHTILSPNKYNSSHTTNNQHNRGRGGYVTETKSRSKSDPNWISHQQDDLDIMEIVRVMGMDEHYHQSVFDENMALIETPLIAPPSTHYSHHHNAVTYPYNLTAFQGGGTPVDNVLVDITSEKQSGQDVPSDSSSEIIKLHFQSTCHTALDTCREDSSCATSLQPMLMHCEMHRCNRNACMTALQSFYKGPHEDLSLDVAFCLCKKTSNRHDMCMIAQEKLHPICAQRPPDSINPQNSNGIFYHPPPACHVVADLCKEDAECRSKLEYYEQACAVDSVTKKCAGRASSCRSAMLGILGTSLRTTCACQGTDLQHLYECLGWQRLLWLNPCVVESQKDFHMKRLAELGLLITTTSTTTTTTPRPQPTTPTTTTPLPPPPIPMIPHKPVYPHITVVKTEAPLDITYVEPPDSIPETLLHNGNEPNGNILGNGANGNNNGNGIGKGNNNGLDYEKGNEASEEQLIVLITTSTTELETTSTTITTTTTTTEPTTTPAPRNCVVQRPHQSDQLIPEGSSRRIYSLDDAECSELCTCGESLTLTCHALCVPFAPCRTDFAFYSHASPAYQAFRGRCLCYSGRFICMRPPQGEYFLPGGVFLLLGYSSTDEALLRPHTNLGVQDAVRALQQYVVTHIDNQTSCTLTLFNMTDENIIISARLPHDPKVKSIELLRREKAECTSILETISHHINSEHSELQAHRLLSIFKMSEVQVIWPETSSSTRLTINLIKTTKYNILAVAIIPTVRWAVFNKFFPTT